MRAQPLWINRLSEAHALFARLVQAPREVAGVAYLAEDARVVALRIIPGDRDRVTVSPRMLTIDSLCFGARGVIVAHNHPSGDPTPSSYDLEHARMLARALGLVDVRLVDHLIVTTGAIASLRAMGLV